MVFLQKKLDNKQPIKKIFLEYISKQCNSTDQAEYTTFNNDVNLINKSNFMNDNATL